MKENPPAVLLGAEGKTYTGCTPTIKNGPAPLNWDRAYGKKLTVCSSRETRLTVVPSATTGVAAASSAT